MFKVLVVDDDADLLDTGSGGLFHVGEDQREHPPFSIDDRQELLAHNRGHREQAGSETEAEGLNPYIEVAGRPKVTQLVYVDHHPDEHEQPQSIFNKNKHINSNRYNPRPRRHQLFGSGLATASSMPAYCAAMNSRYGPRNCSGQAGLRAKR